MFDFLGIAEKFAYTLEALGDFFFQEVPLLHTIATALNVVLPSELHINTSNISVGTMLFGTTVISILLYKLLKFVVGIVKGS